MILKINDRIRNTQVKFFNSLDVTLAYDSVASVFSFDFYFDPEDQKLIDLACIGHYHLVTIEDEGDLLLTGVILNESFSSSATRKMVKITGYSSTGVLEDCQIPTSLYPLQNDKLTLAEITSKLLKPFELSYTVDSSVSSLVNSTYDTTTANESQSIRSYLSDLASQKNIILTHTTEGKLLYTRATTNKKPILELDESGADISMNLTFNGQGMHSDITVMKQASAEGGNAGESTVKNPFVPYVYRPMVKVQNSGNDNDTELAAKNILAKELKNLKLTITLNSWRVNGKIITPNNIVSVKNKEIYIFTKTRFFIESVQLKGTTEAQTAVLNCYLPSVYDGSTPKYIFDHINLH